MAGDKNSVCAGKHMAERQAQRRHAPYTRHPRNTRSSFTDNIISICEQLSRPLFGRSPGRKNDVFSVPWRTVDRETAQLREELDKAQQLESETDSVVVLETESAAESEVAIEAEPASESSAELESLAELESSAELEEESESSAESTSESEEESEEEFVKEPTKSPYESVFDTVRKMAKSRSQEPETPLAGKGKEPELPEEEEDEDFEPVKETDDDDEEEELQLDMEPIDEAEEVTTAPGSGDASAEAASVKAESVEPVPSTREQSVDISIEEESSSAEISDEEVVEPDTVEEPQSSEVESGSEQDEQALAESEESEEEAEESEEEAVPEAVYESEEDDVAVEVVYENDEESDAVSVDSDQATEELASIASAESVSFGDSSEAESDAEEATQPLPESPAEPVDSATSAQQQPMQQTPSSRRWWPFSSSSFLGSLLDTQKRKQLHSDSQETVVEAPVLASPTFGQRRMPLKRGSKPFVPASFIDVTNDVVTDTGKRVRVPEHSTLKRHALLSNRRHTALLPSQSTPISSASPSAETVRLSPSPKTLSSKQATPLITVASLGLEARRNSARGYGRQQRRRTGLYYGSGYGLHSNPYTFTPMRSALANDTESSAKEASPPMSVAGESILGNRSSNTAQRILDIIGDVPPTRSQAGLDTRDAINPYELSSPYSVRMRPKLTQRRRVLVPLSTRLTQEAEGKKPVPESQSARAVLESIQSAAPPEILARLSAGSKAVSDTSKKPMLTAAPKQQPEKPQPEQSQPKQSHLKPVVDATPPPPTNAQISTPSTILRPKDLAVPTPTKIAAPVKTTAPVKATSPVKPIAPVKTTTPAKPTAPVKKSEPLFSFMLPSSISESQIREAAKARVASLAVTELPSFVFTLDGQQTVPPPTAATKLQSLGQEWECEMCELKSPASADKCVVCEAPKPAAKLSASRPAAPVVVGKEWECSVCELKSPATADKCIVCESARPAAQSSVVKPAAPVLGSTGKEWECGVCELKSPAAAEKCTVCDAPKPAPKQSQPAAKPVAAASIGKEWECSVCELKSPASADKCTVCEAPKPVSAPRVDKPAAPALDSTSKEWTCAVCDLQSPESADKCIVCDAVKPVPRQAPGFAFDLDTSKKPAVPSSWSQSAFRKPALSQGQWECGVCELKNPMTADKCTVCEAAKPGAVTAAAPVVAIKRKASDLPVFELDLDTSKRPVPPNGDFRISKSDSA
ncbi:hypothetical protein IWW43_001590 [Coemansia sp. RSA 1935]|nr:hypothetical protein IWW43_001590 [Coemansia sp. RSA 1935]